MQLSVPFVTSFQANFSGELTLNKLLKDTFLMKFPNKTTSHTFYRWNTIKANLIIQILSEKKDI